MLDERGESILAELHALRASDAPTHGGKLLSYVYDSGLDTLDHLAAKASEIALPVNGLDPTAFPSVAVMEKELITFAKTMLHAGHKGRRNSVQGTITSGGTESCMLAVKTARDLWRSEHPTLAASSKPRIVAPGTVHAAFQKAAHYFDMTLDLVGCDADGIVSADELISRLDRDVAIVVVSAPSYPTAQLDPVIPVARAAAASGISCHVDACIGGFALPWWPGLPNWDFRVPGVTSVSADFHKFGFAPKGVSVLLQRGIKRHRKQFFATKKWAGYPVVNPTMLGSKSAQSLAASWAIVQYLGHRGYKSLVATSHHATSQIAREISDIQGLRLMGNPTGPLLAATTDLEVAPEERVDPHHFADEMKSYGFLLQHQPGIIQANGVRIPHSVHLTVTPVTADRLPELIAAMRKSADATRGEPRANPKSSLYALRLLGLLKEDAQLTPQKAGLLLRAMGIGGSSSSLPKKMAPMMRLLEELPAAPAEALLTEIIARLSN